MKQDISDQQQSGKKRKNPHSVSKVYFLNMDQAKQKLERLEDSLKQTIEQNPDRKSRKNNLLSRVKHLRMAIQNPDIYLKDPDVIRQKKQKDQERRINKKIEKGQIKRQEIEQTQLMNQKGSKQCLNCRQFGHLMKDCPQQSEQTQTHSQIQQQSQQQIICYNCGSNQHTLFHCKQKRKRILPFAECFYCKKKGHIARDCKENEKGLYSKGGGCYHCNSVRHVAKKCPYNPENGSSSRNHNEMKDEGEGIEPEY